jgi:transcription antitermination factor NusG
MARLDARGGGRTEGGEALPAVEKNESMAAPSGTWHVLWTHSNCEQLVCDQLAARGFHPFLPKMDAWSAAGGRGRMVPAPLFPGYLFLNDSLDKAAHTEARKVRGLVRILGEGWDRPAVVPEAEIEAIRVLVNSGLPALCHPYLKEGRRVRIVAGPLAHVEGILVEIRPDKGLLVLSVDMLQRSVAVQIDWTQAVPA